MIHTGKHSFGSITPSTSSHLDLSGIDLIVLHSDVLSFYKEELAGERDNYVHDRALVTDKSISTVLTELVSELVESIERARSILKGDKEKEAWERLLAGYVAYHYTTPRYRLAELLEVGKRSYD